jgi:hypothetical protein
VQKSKTDFLGMKTLGQKKWGWKKQAALVVLNLHPATRAILLEDG